jgi:NADH-quinone oxidoreductase subunit N
LNPVITLQDINLLAPEICCAVGGVLVLALDMLFRGQSSKRLVELCAAGALALASWLLVSRMGQPPAGAFGGMVADSGLADAFRWGLCLVGLLTLVLARQQGEAQGLLRGEFYALILFATAAMMLFTVCQDLMLAFVALETFSLAMYVLAGFNKAWHGNREAALKYFLLGAFAAAFFLAGLALIYGSIGSVNLASVSGAFKVGLPPERMLLLEGGLALVLCALLFKVGVAPFHLWVPDVYSGATTPVTAFLGAAAKLAAFGALLRLLGSVPAQQAPFPQVLGGLAILTLLAGNLGALKQDGLKRLLAYSSIAHSGYALVGLLGLGAAGSGAEGAVLSYVLVYGVMNYLAFGLVAAGERQLALRGEARPLRLGDLAGLGFERPWFGLAMAVAMVSMAGLPPTAGFIVKFAVFKAALVGGHPVLASLAILNSVVSAAVYLRVLVALYMLPKEAGAAGPSFSWPLGLLCATAALALLALGVLPNGLAALAGG